MRQRSIWRRSTNHRVQCSGYPRWGKVVPRPGIGLGRPDWSRGCKPHLSANSSTGARVIPTTGRLRLLARAAGDGPSCLDTSGEQALAPTARPHRRESLWRGLLLTGRPVAAAGLRLARLRDVRRDSDTGLDYRPKKRSPSPRKTLGGAGQSPHLARPWGTTPGPLRNRLGQS